MSILCLRSGASRRALPCAHGPSRAASSMLCERSERADNKLDNAARREAMNVGCKTTSLEIALIRTLCALFDVFRPSFELPDVAWPAARSAALWEFCRRQNAPEGSHSETTFEAI